MKLVGCYEYNYTYISRTVESSTRLTKHKYISQKTAVCVCVCVRACVRACVRVCVRGMGVLLTLIQITLDNIK